MSRQIRTLSLADEMRVLVGLAVQPLVVFAVAFFAFPLILLDADGRTVTGGYPSDVQRAALSVALGAVMVAVVVTLLAVFPTAVWVMKRRDVSLSDALLWGLGLGSLPYILLGVAAGGFRDPLRGLAFASLLGTAGATVFWFISIRARPHGR